METAKTMPKPAKNGRDPIITDLNLTIATMKMSGKRNVDIARELGVTESAISQQLSKVKSLVNLKANGEIEDPINNHRARLMQRLKKGEKVIDYTLRPKTFKKNHQQLAIANTMTIAMYKGLGVLVDKTEVSGQVDLLAQRRDDMRARLDACRQFGLNPADELPAIMAVVEPDKVNVSRETQSEETVNKAETPATPPYTPAPEPIKVETFDDQPMSTTQAAVESSQVDADSPQAKPQRQTLSNSKW